MIVNKQYVDSLREELTLYYENLSLAFVAKSTNAIFDLRHSKDLLRLWTLFKLLQFYDVNASYHNEDLIFKIKREYTKPCCKNVSARFYIIYTLSNLQSSATSSSITLTWDYNNKTVSKYQIQKSLDNNNWVLVNETVSKTYTDSYNLNHNTLYYYRVRVEENGIYSDYVYTSARTLHLTPTNLIATGTDESSLRLEWDEINSGESGYQVDQYNSSSGEFENLGTTVSNVNYFDVTGLNEGEEYTFRVRAINNLFNNNSEYAELTTYTKLLAPTLLVDTVTQNTVLLTWQENSAVETNVMLEISKDGGNTYFSLHTLPADTEEKLVENLQESFRYYFRVKVVNLVSESNYSNIVDPLTDLVAPSNVIAIANELANDISFDNLSLTEDEIIIEVRDYNGNWVELVTLPADTITYQDTNNI